MTEFGYLIFTVDYCVSFAENIGKSNRSAGEGETNTKQLQ